MRTRIKDALLWVGVVLLAAVSYIECRELAVTRRGNSFAFGGEVLVPMAVIFFTFILKHWNDKEED